MRKPASNIVTLSILAIVGVLTAQVCTAQILSGPMIGQDEQAWQIWNQALEAIGKEKYDEANSLLEKLDAAGLSPLRLALMADRTGTSGLERAIEDGRLAEAAKSLMQKVSLGRKQRALAEDGWHYAAIGRFDLAKAHFEALIKENPDPVALLELANYNPNRQAILLQLADRPDIGKTARAVLDLLKEGEFRLRTDPQQIIRNIRKLAGTARQRLEALPKLKRSGEWAVPFMLDILLDPQQKKLHAHVISALPEIGKPAVTPLCISLAMKNEAVKVFVIRALGKIGYPHAVPYLQRLVEDPNASDQVKREAALAIRAIEEASGRKFKGSAAQLFADLAEAYYYDRGSLMAEPDAPVANVWYWKDGHLTALQVPPIIYNEIMALRCCETALQLKPDFPEAIALWLATNFRREAQLGVGDIESDQPDPATTKDPTRPRKYPRAVYFARVAGPRYNHMVLARGLKDGDLAVILGSLAALRETAGASSLIGSEDYKQPLVKALTFPNLVVRIKAALALGNALPKKKFAGSQNVIPALAEALSLTGSRHALVVEPDQENLNRVSGALRNAGFLVVAGTNFYEALDEARKRTASIDLILLASNLEKPVLGQALAELKKDYLFAAAPVVILMRPADMSVVLRMTALDERLGRVDWKAPAERLLAEYERVRRRVGAVELDATAALDLATQAAETLKLIAITSNPVYDFRRAEVALIKALNHPSEDLRITAAAVLAVSDSPAAQRAVAQLALDERQPKRVRLAAFGSLADSAKANGNLLDEETVAEVVKVATAEPDLALRAAASKALGALNLPSNQASRVICQQVGK